MEWTRQKLAHYLGDIRTVVRNQLSMDTGMQARIMKYEKF